jgi:Ca2+-binding EF-hand superfamily protein
VVSWPTLEGAILAVDYRSQEDVLSRKVDEIVAILKTQKADPVKVFDQIDLNHSGSLDFSEFTKFLVTIAPKYTKEEVLQIFRLFDRDKNGLISKQEFLEFITSKMPSNRQTPNIQTFEKERAARNMSQLAGYIKWMNIGAETIVKMADADGNRKLNFKEFSAFVTAKLGFKTSEEEIGELFALINRNNDGVISVEELAASLK